MASLVEIVMKLLLENFVAVFLFIGLFILLSRLLRRRNLPPKPWAWPIVGHVYSFSKVHHVYLTEMAKKYGDVFRLQLGSREVVVLSGAEVIKEALVKQNVKFAGRPMLNSWLESNEKWDSNIIYEDYSETFAAKKQILVKGLHDIVNGNYLKNVESCFQRLMKEALNNWLGDERSAVIDDTNYKWKFILARFGMEFVYGKQVNYNDARFAKIVRMTDQVWYPLEISPSNFVPLINFFKKVPNVLTGWLEDIAHYGIGEDNFVTRSVEEFKSKLSKYESKVKEESLDQIAAMAFATVYTDPGNVLDWFLNLMLHHPEAQARLQEEIDRVVGRDRQPNLEDIKKMPYTRAVVFEIIRWSPAVPLSVFHSTTVDTTLQGFHIPRDTIIIPNHHAVNFDPKLWNDPYSFNPARFLGEDGETILFDKYKQLVTFSLGKRRCPGKELAEIEFMLLVSNFCHACTAEKVNETDYTLEAKDSAFSLCTPKPYRAKITLRD